MIANRWVILAAVFTMRTAFGFQFQSVASVSDLLREDMVISHGQIGLLIGLYMLPGIFIALPGGFLVKRFSDRRLAVSGMLFMTLGGLAMAAFDVYSGAVAGRVVSGTGSVLLNVVATKIVVDWFAEKDTRTALAIMLASWPFGIALGLLSQGWIAENYSWQTVMLIAAVFSGVGLVCAQMFIRSAAGVAESATGPLFAISRRELVLASLAGMAWAAYNVGFAIHISYTPGVLVEAGRTAVQAGAIVSAGIWLTIFTTPIGGYLVEQSGRPYTIMLVLVVFLAFTVGAFPTLGLAVLLSISFGVWTGPSAGPIVAMPSEVLRPENRGPGIGIFYTWYYGAMAVGPSLAGASRDWTGSVSSPSWIASGMYLGVFIVVVVFRKYARREHPIT